MAATATYSERRDWHDRVVAVTGGNSGIGRAFVERLATDGANVIACGRNEATLRDLQNDHPTIQTFRCDITVRQDVLALAAAIQDRHGALDVLINNAGIMEHVDLLDDTVSDDRIANEIAVNLTGPILLTRRLLPLLRRGRDPADRHDQFRIRAASGHARADLFGEQGRASFLHDGAAPATGRCGHSGRRSSAAIGRYAGDERCPGAEDVGRCIGRPGVARYREGPGRKPPRYGRTGTDHDAPGSFVHRAPCRGDVIPGGGRFRLIDQGIRGLRADRARWADQS